jgi:hypothetical protein
MKFIGFLKGLFVSKFWIKAVSAILALCVVALLNI